MELSMERLSTGKRINSASDDAAGVAIASRLTAEITGTNMAIRNAMDGQALIDTAEGAHQEVGNILQRMRELAVQSANDTNDSTDRANLQVEIDQLVAEIDRISQASTWAGQQLLDGTGSGSGAASFAFQIGSGQNAYDSITTTINATSAAALGLNTTATLSVGSISNGATNAPVSFDTSTGKLTVASTYSNSDVTVAQKIGGASATDAQTGLSITDAAGVITVNGAAIADADVIVTKPTAMTSLTVSDTGGVVSITAGDVLAADHAYADISSATGVAITTSVDNKLTVTAAAGSASGTLTYTMDGHAHTFAVVTGVDTTATIAAKLNDAINGATSTTQVRSSISGSVVTLERIGIAKDQAGSLSFFVDGQQNDVAIAAGDSVDAILTKIKTDFDALDSSDPHVASAKSLTNATTGTLTFTRQEAIADGSLDITLESNTAVSVSFSKGDSLSDIATAIAAQTFTGATDAASTNTVTFTRDFSAGDITFDLNGSTITTTLDGTESATQAATKINTQITAAALGDAVNTDNGDGTVSISAVDFSVTTTAAALKAIGAVDAALNTVNSQRATLGAVSNRLDSTVNNLTSISSNLQGGKGRIEDADFAAETTSLAKSQILQQASTAMLAQANASKQNVLSLLQG
jgi:flagellin